MKILLTGASGFVGRSLVKLLSQQGHELVHVVHKPQGLANEVLWDFQNPLPSGLSKCDVVIHLAAYVDFESTLNMEQYRVNTIGTMHLAEFAKRHNAYMIFSSMAGIHGSKGVVDEQSPIQPESGYGLSKYLAEEAVKLLVSTHSVLRIAGIYGLDGPTHLGLNVALSEAVHFQKPPVLKGPGTAQRNYIFVGDVARWTAELTKEYAEGKPPPGLLYLAGPETLAIKEYLQAIVDIILPGKNLVFKKGETGHSMIVKGSPPPFPLTPFADYLASLNP